MIEKADIHVMRSGFLPSTDKLQELRKRFQEVQDIAVESLLSKLGSTAAAGDASVGAHDDS